MTSQEVIEQKHNWREPTATDRNPCLQLLLIKRLHGPQSRYWPIMCCNVALGKLPGEHTIYSSCTSSLIA